MATSSNHYSTKGFRRNELTPLRVLWDNNLFKVPVIIQSDGHYCIHIKDDSQRIYTDDTLPDCIKIKLTMTKAQSDMDMDTVVPTAWLDVYEQSFMDVSHVGKYVGRFMDGDLLFMLLLTYDEFSSLCGETLNKERE